MFVQFLVHSAAWLIYGACMSVTALMIADMSETKRSANTCDYNYQWYMLFVVMVVVTIASTLVIILP